MIKILDGTKETVSFEENSYLLCYDNVDYEEYPIHWHTPIEVLMPTEGKYTIYCADTRYDLRVNDVLIIGPGVLHRMNAESGRRIIFQCGMTLLNTFSEFESFFSFRSAILITPEEYPEIHEEVSKLMIGIRDEYFSNAPLKDAAICSMLLKILVMVNRSYTEKPDRFPDIKPTKQIEYIEKFMKVCDHINAHCTEDLSLDSVAETAGFSKFHFSRLFKEFAGVPFYKYLNGRRIDYAEKLLMDPNINVMEVASRSGFNSLSAFMRMFKIIKGCTPTEFRNLYERKN
ncbi:MAG: AraC family transcriptional regulator [Lachnospiraceae bacterium]|nr:AraC family transcriptional regulator [Lachnospiraceae bacterium]